MQKVDITVGSHIVIVESSTGSLEEVSAKALELFQATRAPEAEQSVGPQQNSVGFANTERSPEDTYTSGYQMF